MESLSRLATGRGRPGNPATKRRCLGPNHLPDEALRPEAEAIVTGKTSEDEGSYRPVSAPPPTDRPFVGIYEPLRQTGPTYERRAS